MWKIKHSDQECIEDENGTILSSMEEIVEMHNERMDGLLAEIASLKEEVNHLKYNILVKTYDRTQGH